jgi:hypothetical protein
VVVCSESAAGSLKILLLDRTVKTVDAETVILNIFRKDDLPVQYSTMIFESTAYLAPDSDITK